MPDTNSPSAEHRCLVLQICCWPVEGEGAGFGIEMVQALDAAHAQDIARAQHPTGRLSAVPAELPDGQDTTSCWRRGLGDRGEVCGARELLSVVHDPVVLPIF